MKPLYIGLMSGTSMDGVDAVIASFDDPHRPIDVVRHAHTPFDTSLRKILLALNEPGFNDLHTAAVAANTVATVYADAVRDILSATDIQPERVTAIGAHGQTVRHRPGEFDNSGYTVQLINGALLAEMTAIDVICDFRSRDVAAGGQGAPLVPAFHKCMFGKPGAAIAVLNIGGIANLTLLREDGSVGGFDCGPGNALLDLWCQRHLGTDYDASGAWSAAGTINHALLHELLADPYFEKPLPKSTGRDHFNAHWLDGLLASTKARGLNKTADTQATLAELTAQSVAAGLKRYLPETTKLLVCGGGVFNLDLLRRLRSHLPQTCVQSTHQLGIDPMLVEAAAFAWLAQRFVLREPGNCPEVTGAKGHRTLGSLYPA